MPPHPAHSPHTGAPALGINSFNFTLLSLDIVIIVQLGIDRPNDCISCTAENCNTRSGPELKCINILTKMCGIFPSRSMLGTGSNARQKIQNSVLTVDPFLFRKSFPMSSKIHSFSVQSFQMASLGTAVIGNALSYTSAETAFLPWLVTFSNAMQIMKLIKSDRSFLCCHVPPLVHPTF